MSDSIRNGAAALETTADAASSGPALEPISHERAFELLPWLANGSLSASERRSVELHVRTCLPCRVELKEQQALAALVSEHPTVHVSAEEGFERLRHSLDAAANGRRGHAGALSFARLRPQRPVAGRRAAVAAGVAVAAAGALWFGSNTYRQGDGADTAPSYLTASDPAGAERFRIDVIFAAGTTEEQMRALLEELGAAIVGGPTPVGRYTLALGAKGGAGARVVSDSDVDAVIRGLEDDDRVRFAGRTFAPAGSAGEAQ